MRILSAFFFILLVLIGISFACLNAEPVIVNYYIGQSKLPLSILLVMTFGAGLLIGFIMLSFRVVKLKAKLRRLKGRIKLSEKEVENLRAIPLKDEH